MIHIEFVLLQRDIGIYDYNTGGCVACTSLDMLPSVEGTGQVVSMCLLLILMGIGDDV